MGDGSPPRSRALAIFYINVFCIFQHGGGLVYEKATEYSITYAPPDYEVMGDEELYSYKHIKDCCDQNRLLDLRPYR
mgnify:CR=1 FL=1